MTNQDWMKDHRLKHIDAEKLNFLQKLVFEMQKLSDKEKLPFLMALATSSRKKHISFTSDEVSKIIEVIKEYSSEEDIKKMNKILTMFSQT